MDTLDLTRIDAEAHRLWEQYAPARLRSLALTWVSHPAAFRQRNDREGYMVTADFRYNPAEARVPRGREGGGRWVRGSTTAVSTEEAPAQVDDKALNNPDPNALSYDIKVYGKKVASNFLPHGTKGVGVPKNARFAPEGYVPVIVAVNGYTMAAWFAPSAAPKPDTLIEPKDYKDVAQAAADLHNRYPGVGFFFDGLKLDYVKATASAFITVADRYPEALTWLEDVTCDPLYWNDVETGMGDLKPGKGNTTYAVTTSYKASRGRSRIILNPKFYGADGLEDRLMDDVATGWHPVGTESVGSILVHEFGHVVDRVLEATTFGRGEKMPDGQYVNWAIARQPSPNPVMRGFSKYGRTDPTEMVAEVFAAMELNPDSYPIGRRTNGLGVYMDNYLSTVYPKRVPWRGVHLPGKGKSA